HVVAIANGDWRPASDLLPATRAAVTTVLAASGYPDHPELGAAIALPAVQDDVLVFHAGTTRGADGVLRVHGGRVLGVTGLGRTVPDAAGRSTAACERIEFSGKTWRRDIAWRETRRAGAA
ncbi:MAG: phosphoribosylglycinamide synthetase C domain-containing protein, partial [Gammaproteobacteria bacterium]